LYAIFFLLFCNLTSHLTGWTFSCVYFFLRFLSQIKNPASVVRLPLLIAISITGGILLGATIFSHSPKTFRSLTGYQKIREVLTFISNDYVDSFNTYELVDYSIEKLLEKLDPHTVYIPKSEVQMAKSQLESNFDGIGVEFNIFRDTVQVVSVLANGPSEGAGLQTGDKIVEVDGKPMFEGKKPVSSMVFKKLRGPRGSKVQVGIVRNGVSGLLPFTITRGRIPQYSVEAAYLIDDKTAYIKISNFADNTYEEFRQAMEDLRKQGMQQLMLDLRGNPGGYLDRAVSLIDELLDGNKLIVYTNGKGERYDQEYRANKAGMFEKGPVIVLIDEESASASEIVAGALQDNDRALVVGRRSYGKGLVQIPTTLEDGSEIRLTISRYYTPSGRSIQRPYSKEGKTAEYRQDISKRFERGEFFSADSIHFDKSHVFKTLKGRTVYGGGGIMPDYFVPLDTSFNTPTYSRLWAGNIVREYAFHYFSTHKAHLQLMNAKEFAKRFTITDAQLNEMADMASQQGIVVEPSELRHSANVLKTQIKAFIATSLFRQDRFGRRNAYYQVMSANDEIYLKALKLFGEAAQVEKGNFTLAGKK
jgi:carboxyl-terminal processing protease